MRKKKQSINVFLYIMIAISTVFYLTGCDTTSGEKVVDSDAEAEQYMDYLPGDYDSADRAVIYEKNMEDKEITFFNLDVYKTYTLAYDGTSTLHDKYGNALSMKQVKEGDIVDITFLKTPKTLTSLAVSEDSWFQTDVSRVDIHTGKQTIQVGNKTYKFTGNTLLLSEGKRIELMDIHESDILTVNGMGNQVHSLVVDKGHGYLRLKNDESFIGGWIEIGQSVIRTIEEDMLLVVPEGTYDMTVSNKGVNGTKTVTIQRNQETEVDIGEFKSAEPQSGMVIFTVNPAKASVYIDGNLTDISQPVTLEYGIHQIIARAEGYGTVTTYVKVGQPSAGIDITLDPVEEEDVSDNKSDKDTNKESNKESDNNAGESDSNKNNSNNSSDKDNSKNNSDNGSDNNSDNDKNDNSNTGNSEGELVSAIAASYKIHIDNPTGFEIYFDGNYKGIAPVSFKKELGSHVVTIRKDGYITRSYTVDVEDDQSDVTFSFEILEEK